MTEERKLPEMRFDETTGNFFIHETTGQEVCKDGKPHQWAGWREFEDGRGGTQICSVCGISAFEHSMRYGP